MDANVSEWVNAIVRWVHVVAGILWIGHLYFFNFVNGPLAATYDADTKKKVIPQLMPRALFWFRWGAAHTWITGFILLVLVYYMGGALAKDGGTGMSHGISVGVLIVSWLVYDMLWKSPLAKNEKVGAAVSFVLVAATLFGLSQVFTGRAVFIHLGGIFGTIMAANVWMRIWPAQKKLIAAAAGGPAADAAVAPLAKLRSKHNTYMSVPLVYTMVSNHFPGAYGSEHGWLIMLAMVAVGWLAVMQLYKKSAGEAPTRYGAVAAK
jgi:uncharacterized membrane protein